MKKEIVGKKIKILRGETKQLAIFSNQAQLSQIESGKIENPKKSTLMEIIKGLNEDGKEITFEELVEGTTWVESKSDKSAYDEVAFSPSILNVKLSDEGALTINHKSYSLYNKDGEKNEFCPETGERLIEKCSKCARKIESGAQKYCMGCGSSFFDKIQIPEVVNDVLNHPPNFVDANECYNAVTMCDGYLQELLRQSNGYDLFKITEDNPDEESFQITYKIQITEHVLSFFKKRFINDYEDYDSKGPTDDGIKTHLLMEAAKRLIESIKSGHLKDSTLLSLIKDLGSTNDINELVEKLESTSSSEKEIEQKISEYGISGTNQVEDTELDNENANKQNNKTKGDKNV